MKTTNRWKWLPIPAVLLSSSLAFLAHWVYGLIANHGAISNSYGGFFNFLVCASLFSLWTLAMVYIWASVAVTMSDTGD
jgi:hypothetical protein